MPLMLEADKYSLWVKKEWKTEVLGARTEWDLHYGSNKRSRALDVPCLIQRVFIQLASAFKGSLELE